MREFEHGKNRVKDLPCSSHDRLFALDPRLFGRGRVRELPSAPPTRRPIVSDDLKLFATTFAAGFVFVSILIADRLRVRSVAGEVELPPEPRRNQAHRRDEQQLADRSDPRLLKREGDQRADHHRP